MKNHLNILPKLALFDLKCFKMGWRLGLRPRPRWGSLRRSPRPPNRKRQRAVGARHSLFRVHFYISIPLPGPSLTEFLDPPLRLLPAQLPSNSSLLQVSRNFWWRLCLLVREPAIVLNSSRHTFKS